MYCKLEKYRYQDVMSTLFRLWKDVRSTVFCVLLHLFVHLDFISLKFTF